MNSLTIGRAYLYNRIIAATFAVCCANAASITVTCPTAFVACSGISYTVSSSSPSVGLSFTPTSTSGTNWGVLTETATFSNLNSLSIDFLENSPYADTVNNFGFRVTSVQNISNASGLAWSGIQETLQDASPQVIDNAVHPGFAHFHSDPGLSLTPFTAIGTFNSTASLTAAGGTLANGASFSATGIGLHEWSVPAAQRHFTLVETPIGSVPEPATVCLGAVGLLLLATVRRRN